MITPTLKDKLLSFLCNNLDYEKYYNCPKSAIEVECIPNEINAMLSQFNRMGFLSQYAENSMTYSFCFHIEAQDFLSRGGFVAQEEILKNNIEKLNSEIQFLAKELEPSLLERAKSITTIAANIMTVIGSIKS